MRAMYWAIRRDYRNIFHIIAIISGFIKNYLRIRIIHIRNNGKKIVAVSQVERLGDIIAISPVSQHAKKKYCEDMIYWVSKKSYASFASEFTHVDGSIAVECLTEWMLIWASGLVDVTFDTHINGLYCLKCRIPLKKSGHAGKINYGNYYNYGTLLEIACLSAGVPPLDFCPTLPLDRASARKVDALLLPDEFVVIHCASDEAARDWPYERWRSLVSHINQVLALDVVEIGLAPRVVHSTAPRQRSLCGQLSILETAEVIRRARLFIGIDSGPAHLANAVGTRGVILLGAYRNFKRYTPYSGAYGDGRLAELVRAEGPVSELDVAPVIEAVERGLALSRGERASQ